MLDTQHTDAHTDRNPHSVLRTHTCTHTYRQETACGKVWLLGDVESESLGPDTHTHTQSAEGKCHLIESMLLAGAFLFFRFCLF